MKAEYDYNKLRKEFLELKARFDSLSPERRGHSPQTFVKRSSSPCFHCHQEGHYKRDCPLLKNRNSPRGPPGPDQGSLNK